MMKFTDAICLRKRYAVSSCGAEEVPVVSCGAVVSSCSAEEVAFVSSAGGPFGSVLLSGCFSPMVPSGVMFAVPE